MPTLFNRNIRVIITTFSGTQNPVKIAESTIEDIPISVNLSKSRFQQTENTGVVTITNLTIENSQVFTNVVNPYLLTYEVKAGYGDGIDLPLLSRGYVTETTWEHEGGDIKTTFYVNEGPKFKGATIDSFVYPKSSSVTGFIERLERSGQAFDFIPNRDIVLQDLRTIKIPTSRVILNIRDALDSLLEEAGYAYYTDNETIVIRRKPSPLTSNAFLVRNQNVRTILNFKSGLLSADAENSYDYQHNTRTSWVKFSSLFIPELFPSNNLTINEPRYPHIQGDYVIDNVDISLNNKNGPFFSSGRALHVDFKDPRSGETVEETERRSRLR